MDVFVDEMAHWNWVKNLIEPDDASVRIMSPPPQSFLNTPTQENNASENETDKNQLDSPVQKTKGLV